MNTKMYEKTIITNTCLSKWNANFVLILKFGQV